MNELNKNTLKKALAQLPEYEPGPVLWDAIEQQVEAVESQQRLQEAVAGMRTYAPPAKLWDQISEELDVEPISPRRRFHLSHFVRYAAAAVLGIGLICYYGLSTSKINVSPTASVSYSYEEETVDAELLAHDWDNDDDAFAMVISFCQQEAIVCQQPEFKTLKGELEELNEAREELKAALGEYGGDPGLIAQLTRIEHERSDVLKQMIAKI